MTEATKQPNDIESETAAFVAEATVEATPQPLWSNVLDWKEKYEEEKAIVDRVWKALGIETYEQAHGLAIDEIVSATKARVEQLEAALKMLPNNSHLYAYVHSPHGDYVRCLMCNETAVEIREMIHRDGCVIEVARAALAEE